MLLIVNAGSSSLKVALYNYDAYEKPVRSVFIEGIGSAEARLLPDGLFGSADTQKVVANNHTEAAQLAHNWFEQNVNQLKVDAIGYRVVHGGERFSRPALVDTSVIDYLRQIAWLAPNHMHSTIDCLQAFAKAYPDLPHVACFDTSFFADLPPLARRLPIPAWLDQEGVRRYGFHGLSYSYLLASFKKHEGELAANGRIIMLHLGSGASLAALKDGKPVDMTMGFTPVSGIAMSTRTGDIEPGVMLYLLKNKAMSVDEVADLVSNQSGLLGVSGVTSDMYELLQNRQQNQDVALAINLFCYQIKKQIAAFAAVLGGVDSIIFTGGIGERSAVIRQQILDGLDFLGINIDDKHNHNNERLISAAGSQVGVHVIPAREDYMIATQTAQVVKGGQE